MKLVPKNWNDFQQYKDRKPLWIKLHRDLLNDFSYSSVQIGTKATLPLLWLLACEYEDGIIDASLEEISFRIHIDVKTVDKAIKELIECKFFTLVQDCTELYETVPREEKRREEKETVEFTFSLTRDTHYSNLSKEYKDNLKEEILKIKGNLDYEDFIMSLESVSKYKYKNFLLVYKKWNNKSKKTIPEEKEWR